MSKLSFIKFDVYDWINDTRSLSAEAKGCWIDILCFMWNAPQRGVWEGTYEEFARVTGTPWESAPALIAELEKVASVTKRNNLVTLINRRMQKEQNAFEDNANRQRAFREKHKSNAIVTDKTLKTLDVRRETLDKDKKDNTLEQAPKRPLFLKPSVSEVTAYAKSIGFDLNGSRFCDFYESNGWRVGKNAMKNWQAAVRTWRQNDYGGGKNASNGGASRTDGTAFYDRIRQTQSLRKASFQGPVGSILAGIRNRQVDEEQAGESDGSGSE